MSYGNQNQDDTVKTIASALEDLIYMGVIRLQEDKVAKKDKAIFSAQFSAVMSNIMPDNFFSAEIGDNKIIMLMYHSLLIYMNEHLKLPKSLAIAFANDLEKHGEQMQCSNLIFEYASILQNLFLEKKKESQKY
jgi:hypothetical protein